MHHLLMQLDTDGDGKISLAEWRRGWLKGLVGPTTASASDESRADPEAASTSATDASGTAGKSEAVPEW